MAVLQAQERRLSSESSDTDSIYSQDSSSPFLESLTPFLEKDYFHDVATPISHFSTIASRSTCRTFTTCCMALLPSFLHPNESSKEPKSRNGQSIAALDGIRGIACLFVFNFHLLFTYTWACQKGWGVDDHNKFLVQLPFLRALYSGHLMVHIFFVLSGYVLSFKPLQFMRSRSYEDLFRSLSSSIFRRAIRLYLPVVLVTFITMLSVQAGLWTYATKVRDDKQIVAGLNEQHPPHFPTFKEQFWNWKNSMGHQLDPFGWGRFYGECKRAPNTR